MPLPSLKKTAPDFTLPDQDGHEHTLSDERGSWVLLYFYPKDDTSGCTTEACGIRDALPNFEKTARRADAKIKIFGVSADSAASHKKFIAKYDLNFTLLADENKTIVKKYGVWGKKKFMGREYEGTLRTSFLIDPKGKIAKVYENVNPVRHADEVLADLKTLVAEK